MNTPLHDHVEDPPERWRALAVLATALLLGMTTWFSATAVLDQLRALWALSGSESAWLTIAVQLGFVVGALASALLDIADRIPPRRLMLLGALGAAAANIALLAAPGIWTAILLRGATGFCLASVYPPAMKAMSTWFRAKRGTALGVMVGALTIGSATPHLVTAFGGLDWHVVIVSTSVLTCIGGLLAEYVARDGPCAFSRAPFKPGQIFEVLADRPVRLACIGYFGHMWELYAMWGWFGVFFADVLQNHAQGHASIVALATFCVIGIGAIGCWWVGVLGDRWGRGNATSLAMLISGICCLIIGFLPDLPWPIVLVVGLIWGFWVVADSAQFSTAITEFADQAYVGTALALQVAVGYLLTIPTLWLIPLAHDAYGWGIAFALLAPGPIIGTLAMQKLKVLEMRDANRSGD